MINLLQHFKDLTVHPKNAEELKGLILQLAIQGKLTKKWREQNPDVQPASVLLDKIQEEKAQLINKKKIKKEKLDPVNLDEVYFEVPDNWEWERLGQIGFVFNGDSVNKSVKEAKYSGLKEGYPYIATKDVGYLNDKIDHNNGVRIPFDEPKFKIAKKGTVLICSEGGSAGKKMGIVGEDVCFGNKLYALEQYGNIESVFIQSLYGSEAFQSAFKENMTGIIGGISRNSFAKLYIPLPPLEEQKAIVEIVNQLFAEVEALEEQTKARVQLKEDFVTSALQQLTTGDTITQWSFLQDHFKTFFTEKTGIKKLRESILQLAVQGKLTSHWRSDNPDVEPASVLLDKIKAEKAQLIKDKKIKKEKPLPEITDEEIPYDLPEGWTWCRMGELGFIQGGGTPSKSNPTFWGGDIPWVCPKDMKRPFLDSSIDQITLDGVENSSAKIVNEGSILFVVRGMILAHTFPIGINTKSVTINQDMKALSPHLKGISEYMVTILKGLSNDILDGVERSSHGTCKLQSHFYYNLLIPFPPSKEQKAIVEKVNALMDLCDRLEQEIDHSTTQVEQLMQSCLREVFLPAGGTKEGEGAGKSIKEKGYGTDRKVMLAAEGKSDYGK